jgi:hypothetical protein
VLTRILFSPVLVITELTLHRALVVRFVPTSLLVLAVLAVLDVSWQLVLHCQHVVLGQLAVGEVGLIHLHGMHRHLEHAASAAIRRGTCIRHSTEDGLVHHVHLHCHSLQLHLLHLLILLILHVVHGDLTFSSALL